MIIKIFHNIDEKEIVKYIKNLDENYIIILYNSNLLDIFNISQVYWKGYDIIDVLSKIIYITYLIYGYIFYLPGILIEFMYNDENIKKIIKKIIKSEKYKDFYTCDDKHICFFNKFDIKNFLLNFFEKYKNKKYEEFLNLEY